MERGGPFVEQQLCGRAVFGWPRLLLVVAARSGGLAFVGADGLHIARKLPDLIRRQLAAEGWHSVRPPVPDRGEDRHHLGPVIPPAVEESGTGAATAVTMAALAAEPGIEPLTLAEIVGVGLVRLPQHEIDVWGGASDPIRHQRDLIQRIRSRRIEPQLPFFALA